MKLWSVSIVLKPRPRERKYRAWRYMVMAASDVQAMQRVSEEESHKLEDADFLGIHATEIEDGYLSYRIDLLDKDADSVRRHL